MTANLKVSINIVSAIISSLCDNYYKEVDISIKDHFLNVLLTGKTFSVECLACKFVGVKDLVCSDENAVLKNSGLIPTENDELSHHLTLLSENGEVLFLRCNQVLEFNY